MIFSELKDGDSFYQVDTSGRRMNSQVITKIPPFASGSGSQMNVVYNQTDSFCFSSISPASYVEKIEAKIDGQVANV